MSDINFAKPRSYERFLVIFHIAAAVVCVVLFVLTLCMENGLRFIPIIFAIAAIICFINAFDKVNVIKKTSKQIRQCVFLAVLGVVSLLVAIFTFIGYLT